MKIFLRVLIGLFLAILTLVIIGQILPRPKPPAIGQLIKLPNGMDINVYEKGEGQTIVLIHGLPGSAHDWPELADALVARGFHVVWYDRIGYGHSSRRAADAPHTMQDNGRELDALIAAMDLKNPALVGWSFGGGTVQASMAARNKDTPFIVLMAAVGPSMNMDNRPPDLPGTSIIMRTPILGKLATKAMVSARFDDRVSKRWLGGVRPLLLMRGSLASMRAEMAQMQPSTLDPSDIQTPALIVHGDKDKLVPHSVGIDLAKRITNSKLFTIEDAGHMLPMTYPEQVADAIKSFADQNAAITETDE